MRPSIEPESVSSPKVWRTYLGEVRVEFRVRVRVRVRAEVRIRVRVRVEVRVRGRVRVAHVLLLLGVPLQV